MNEVRSYYGQPIIKEPTWTWEIPTYFFTGGVSGASSVLSLSAKLFGNERLSKTALYVGAVADAVSPLLLISDLGRPERFHHMLRVFKVTSPMNVGAWVLLVNGGASSTAAALELLGILKPLKLIAETVGAFFGPPLATYTGVLLADTAVPVWHEARHELPWLFGASDRWMTACARLMRASGMPMSSSAWAATTAACRLDGSASPMSSLALMTRRRAMKRGSSPASTMRAK